MAKDKKGLFSGLFKSEGCACGVTIVPDTEKKKSVPSDKITKEDKTK